MRVYLPATSNTLRLLVDSGAIGPAPLTAFAVTPDLREWYLDDDLEALEYAAFEQAARAALRMLDADDTAVRRRVVIAADAPDSTVTVRDDLDRGVVQVATPVRIADVASVHADDAEAEATVAAAAAAVVAADLGDADSRDAVDDAAGYELAWYATQEIRVLLASF